MLTREKKKETETRLAACCGDRDDDEPLSAYGEQESCRYLDRGILSHGFVRAR